MSCALRKPIRWKRCGAWRKCVAERRAQVIVRGDAVLVQREEERLVERRDGHLPSGAEGHGVVGPVEEHLCDAAVTKRKPRVSADGHVLQRCDIVAFAGRRGSSLAGSLAASSACRLRAGSLRTLSDSLFACSQPDWTPPQSSLPPGGGRCLATASCTDSRACSPQPREIIPSTFPR